MEIKVIMAHMLRSLGLRTTDRFESVKFRFDITAKPDKPFKIFTASEIMKVFNPANF